MYIYTYIHTYILQSRKNSNAVLYKNTKFFPCGVTALLGRMPPHW